MAQYNHLRSIKEVLRHFLVTSGLMAPLNFLRRRRGQYVEHINQPSTEEIFSSIYTNSVWVNSSNSESLSGQGSTLISTRGLVTELSAFLSKIDCRKLVDVGCGDFNWMKHVTGDFDYIGIDVVDDVIRENTDRYGAINRRFICSNAMSSPIESCDVILCREVIFHLSFKDGTRLINNIKSSNFRYLLMTTDNSVWFNSDILTGDYRPLNLRRSPFLFPEPILILSDNHVASERIIGVWDRSQLSG